MNAFINMLNTQAILLIYLLIGILCRKRSIITIKNQQQYINLVLTILMPCMVFNSFKSVTVSILKSSLLVLIISLLICCFSMLLGSFVYRHYPESKKKVLQYATIINNAGFAGLPLARETFGNEGLIYASIFLIPIRIFVWSAGITILSNEKTDKITLFKKLMKNPCILAVFFGLARGLAELNFPPFAEAALNNLSACVSPLSMIIIGAIIADVNIRTIFEKGVLLYSFIRLLLLPIIVYSVTTILNLPTVIVGTSMILTAMPAATSTALLAAQYNSDVSFASKIVFVTTFLSLFTAPLLMLLM
jgi:hypothetical protein